MSQPNTTNHYKEINSSILDLETLMNQYNNLLISYKQAVTDYVNYLDKKITQPNSTQTMRIINGSTYWGTSSLGENNSTTAQQCQASCARTTGCTGATFNNSDKRKTTTCQLRKGDSLLSVGTSNDYAIVQPGKQLLTNIENINSQLKTVNKNIQDKITLTKPKYNKQLTDNTENTEELIQQFNMLSNDRNKVKKMLEEYETLEEQHEGGNIRINQNYYSFLLLIGLTIIFIITLIYMASSSSQIRTNYQTGGGGVKLSNYYFTFFQFFLFLVIYSAVRFTYLKNTSLS
jgi:hypothetical protein